MENTAHLSLTTYAKLYCRERQVLLEQPEDYSPSFYSLVAHINCPSIEAAQARHQEAVDHCEHSGDATFDHNQTYPGWVHYLTLCIPMTSRERNGRDIDAEALHQKFHEKLKLSILTLDELKNDCLGDLDTEREDA